MNKKWLKFSLYILIILTTVVLTSTVVLGYSYTYKNFGDNSTRGGGPVQILNISQEAFSLIKVAGVIIAVVLVYILAISYMTASPNKKAHIKEKSWMYVVGIVLLIGMPSLLDWGAEIGKTFNGIAAPFTGSSSGGNILDVISPDAEEGNRVNDLFKKKWIDEENNGSYIDSSLGSGSVSGNSTNSSNANSTANSSVNSTTKTSMTPATTATTPEALSAGDTIYYSDGSSETLGAGDSIYYKTGHGYVLKKASGDVFELGDPNYNGGGTNYFTSIKGIPAIQV